MLRSRILAALTFSLTFGLTAIACDDEGSSPRARLFFAHQLYTQGPLEIFIDGKRVGEATSNTIDTSQVREIGTGTHTVTVRARGASLELASAELTFGEQTYLIGIFQRPGDTSTVYIRHYGEGEPESIPAQRAAIQVVNFLTEQATGGERQAIPVDVYVNSALVAAGVDFGAASAYTLLSAGERAVVQVYRAGELPGEGIPLRMSDAASSGVVNVREGKAIVLSLLNTDLSVDAPPKVQVRAFALR